MTAELIHMIHNAKSLTNHEHCNKQQLECPFG